jgi:hypothetical protein
MFQFARGGIHPDGDDPAMVYECLSLGDVCVRRGPITVLEDLYCDDALEACLRWQGREIPVDKTMRSIW